MSEYNWLEASKAYIYGTCNEDGKRVYPSLTEVAKQFGIGHSTLAHKAAEMQWARQRQEAEERIAREAFKKYESEMIAELAHIDWQASRAASIMLDTIVDALLSAETAHERQGLTTKYAKILSDILAAGHNAIGVDQIVEQAGIRSKVKS